MSELTTCRLGTTTAIWVKIIMVYSALGLAITEIFFFGVWCHPLKNYFVVTDHNSGKSALPWSNTLSLT